MTKTAFHSGYFLALVFALLSSLGTSAQFVTRYYSCGLKADIDTSIFEIEEQDDYTYLPFEDDVFKLKTVQSNSKKEETEDEEGLLEFYLSTEDYYVLPSFQEPNENETVDSIDINGFRIYTMQTIKSTCGVNEEQNADTASMYDIIMTRLDDRTFFLRPDFDYGYRYFKKALELTKDLSSHISVSSVEELDSHFNLPLSKEQGQRIIQREYDQAYQEAYNDMLRIYKCSDMNTLRNYLEGKFDQETADTLAVRDAEVIAKIYADAVAKEYCIDTERRIHLLVETQFNYRECQRINKLILEDTNSWNNLLNRLLNSSDTNIYHRLDQLNTFYRWHTFVLPESPQNGRVTSKKLSLPKHFHLSPTLLLAEISRHLYNDTVFVSTCEIIPDEHNSKRALLLIHARGWKHRCTYNRLIKLEQNQNNMWQYQELKLPFDGDSATALNFEQYPLKNDFGFMLKYSPNGWDHYLIFNNDIENATALETRYMSAVYGGPLKMCAINSWKEINQLEARSTNEYYAPLAAINTDSLFPAFQAKFPIPENLEKRYNNTYHSRKKAVFTEEYMIFNDSVLVNKQLFYDFVYTKLTPKQKELICYPIAADLTRDGQDEFFQFAISNGKLLDWWVYKFDEKGTRKMSKHQAKRLIKRTVIYNNMKYASKMGVLEKTVE